MCRRILDELERHGTRHDLVAMLAGRMGLAASSQFDAARRATWAAELTSATEAGEPGNGALGEAVEALTGDDEHRSARRGAEVGEPDVTGRRRRRRLSIRAFNRPLMPCARCARSTSPPRPTLRLEPRTALSPLAGGS
jgi:hypothetical protein